MPFTPDPSSAQEIAPFKLLKASCSQTMPIYFPLAILATSSLVVSIVEAILPSLKVPLNIIDGFILTPLLSGASIYLIYRHLSTQTADLGGAITEALDKTVQLIIGLLLYGIAVVLGLCLLVVPGIYLAIRLSFVPQVIMVDDLDAVAALKFSWELVGGRWGRVFVAQLVSVICFIGPIVIISAIAGSVLGPNAETILGIIWCLGQLVALPFLLTYNTKLYLRLKGSDN